MPLCTVLTKWPAPSGPIQAAQGCAAEARGDRLEHRRHRVPGGAGAAAHDRGAVPCALLAAGDADAEVGHAGGVRLGGAAAGVVEVGVAGVDDQVLRREQRAERGDHRVDRRPGRDHQDHRPRRRHARDERLAASRRPRGARRADRRSLDEVLRDGGRSVEDRDGEALLGDVERQRRAHRSQSDQPDLRHFPLVLRECRRPRPYSRSCRRNSITGAEALPVGAGDALGCPGIASPAGRERWATGGAGR